MGTGSPSGRAGAVAVRREDYRSCRPCHQRAIAAVTSGIQRSVTVTPRRPLRRTQAPDLGECSGAKLHGMQGVMEDHVPSLLASTTGRSREEPLSSIDSSTGPEGVLVDRFPAALGVVATSQMGSAGSSLVVLLSCALRLGTSVCD